MSGTNQNIVPNIAFNEIPPPPYYRPSDMMEVRPNFGTVGLLPIPARNLIIAQMITTGGGAGTATPGTIQQNIIQPQQATALFGAGSMAEGCVIKYLLGGSGIPLDVIGIADAGGATKAQWTVTFGGTWSVGGTTAIGVDNVRLATGTMATDTAATSATEWAALVNADPQMPVTAAVATDVVTLTAKNGGLEPNNLQIVVSPASGDALVPGMTVVVAQTAQGASNPTIAASITAIAGLWYTGICAPFQDSTNVSALMAELARRFTATVREDARAWYCFTGTYSQQLAAAAAANSQFAVGLGMTQPQSLPWEIAASLMGVAETSLVGDPSLELKDVALPGVGGPLRVNMPIDTEQELLLAGGVATHNLLASGTVTIQRLACTYNVSGAGVADRNTYLVINETAVASRIRYDWRTYLKVLYPQNKLAPDGSLAEQANPNICTPRRAQTAWARRMLVYASNGWIVNETADAQKAVFRINANDNNRLDYQVLYTRIGNLIVEAGVLEFAAA